MGPFPPGRGIDHPLLGSFVLPNLTHRFAQLPANGLLFLQPVEGLEGIQQIEILL
jgi:hypothetical protein